MTQRGVEEDGVACGMPKHTNHCVCGEKGGEKGFLRVSVVEKAQSKTKTPKPTTLSKNPIHTLDESVKFVFSLRSTQRL